jgi:hypothetical protein
MLRMSEWTLSHERELRLGFFLAVFAVMALWELAAARRRWLQPWGKRWFANLSILAVDTVLVRLLFPAAAVGMALLGESEGWGLFNNLDLPGWLEVVLAVVVLDLVIYLPCRPCGGCTWCTTPTATSTSRPACVSIPSRSCCRCSSSWRRWRLSARRRSASCSSR